MCSAGVRVVTGPFWQGHKFRVLYYDLKNLPLLLPTIISLNSSQNCHTDNCLWHNGLLVHGWKLRRKFAWCRKGRLKWHSQVSFTLMARFSHMARFSWFQTVWRSYWWSRPTTKLSRFSVKSPRECGQLSPFDFFKAWGKLALSNCHSLVILSLVEDKTLQSRLILISKSGTSCSGLWAILFGTT